MPTIIRFMGCSGNRNGDWFWNAVSIPLAHQFRVFIPAALSSQLLHLSSYLTSLLLILHRLAPLLFHCTTFPSVQGGRSRPRSHFPKICGFPRLDPGLLS